MPLPFFGRTNCDLQIPYKLDPNPWKQHQNWLAIERWATYFARNCSGACVPYELVVSNPGILSETPSPPWQSTNVDRTLTRLTLLFGGEIDTSPVTITAYNNSDTVGTITMPAGDNVVHVESTSLDSTYTTFALDGQFLTFTVTDLGDNLASRVTIIAVFDCGTGTGSPPDPPPGGGDV